MVAAVRGNHTQCRGNICWGICHLSCLPSLTQEPRAEVWVDVIYTLPLFSFARRCRALIRRESLVSSQESSVVLSVHCLATHPRLISVVDEVMTEAAQYPMSFPSVACRQHGFSAAHHRATSLSTALFWLVLPTIAQVIPAGATDGLALLEAANNKDLVLVRQLLKEGVDPGFQRPKDKWTALHTAAWNKHTELYELLIASGADVRAANKFKQSVLHIAAMQGDLAIVKSLLLAGADVNAVDVDGFTPLINAVDMGHQEVVKLLITEGADASIQDKRGQSAITRAENKGIAAILQMLLTKKEEL